MSELAERLASEFADKDYAHSYMESHAVSRIAAQVHALRKQRGWSQEKLSELSGIAQERISKIESADFSSLTISTLHKLSRAFDTDLRISFETFSRGILDVVNLTPDGLKVPSRETDLTRFKTLRLKPGANGDWQLIDPTRLALVTSISDTVKPEQVMQTWVRVEPAARPAVAHHAQA